MHCPKVVSWLFGYVLLVIPILWAGARLRKLGIIRSDPEDDDDSEEAAAEEKDLHEHQREFGQLMGLTTKYPADIAMAMRGLDDASSERAINQYDGL